MYIAHPYLCLLDAICTDGIQQEKYTVCISSFLFQEKPHWDLVLQKPNDCCNWTSGLGFPSLYDLASGGRSNHITHPLTLKALKALIPETCWSSGFETFKSKWVMFWESNGDGGRPHLSTSVSSWQPLPLTTKLAPLPLDGEPGQCLRFYCKVDYDQSSMVAMMQSVTNFSNTINKKGESPKLFFVPWSVFHDPP